MNRPTQIVPFFVSVYLLANLVIGGYTTVLFDIIETDGTDPVIYNSGTGKFTCPVSGWYDLDVQLISAAALGGVRIIKNGDTNFPIMGLIPVTANANMRVRVNLGLGETLQIQALGGTILALAGTVPNARASNAIFTLVKRYDDTKTF